MLRHTLRRLCPTGLVALLFIFFLPAPSPAQGLYDLFYHPDSALVKSQPAKRLNVGIIGSIDSLRGVQLELFRGDVRTYTKGVNVALASAFSFGDAQGLQSAFFYNTVKGKMRGLQFSSIANVAGDTLRGAQLAGFVNVAYAPVKGLQFSDITNISGGIDGGAQVSMVANVASGSVRGAQLAAYNFADTLHGWQVGLLNVAPRYRGGWQVGLLNVSRDSVRHSIGLLNVGANTKIDLLLYGGNSTKANFAARFRGRSTQRTIGFGTHYMGLDRKFSGALFYRIGQYVDLSPRWTLSGDLGYYHIETFQENSSAGPQRLFSLQARVQADWNFSKYFGAYMAAGYGTTRHYHHARHYRSRPIIEAGLELKLPRPRASLTPVSSLPAGERGEYMANESLNISSFDSLYRTNQDTATNHLPLPPAGRAGQGKRGAWAWAAAETFGINLLVHSFDRFVMNEDFAQVNLHTIHRNFRKGFVWDNDQFSTNLFAHPYHGNLYFNAARAQGLSFLQSAPFALGGSLMWEFFGEIEPPAINDVLATTFGGICIGEVTHRISDLILRSKSRGFRRFLREFAATAVCPMKGFNRICTGEAWRVTPFEEYASADLPPVDLSLTAGTRYLADQGSLFRGEHNPFLNVFLEYGNPLDAADGPTRPYDFFSLEATVGLSSNQPLINRLHILGRLWSHPLSESDAAYAEFGIYQHFNYYDSKPVRDGSDLTPYRISEAASLGPGLILSMPQMGALTKLQQRVFASAILLGGTKSDYYNVIDRDYNMGSGYSIKSKTHLEFRGFGRFILNAAYFQIFTWKGYAHKDLTTINPLYLNAQGDKGNATLVVLNPHWEYDLSDNLRLTAASSYFFRQTHYAHHPDVRARTFELSLGATYHF